MTIQTTPIAETPNFIILDKYTALAQIQSYQTEADLEREFIADLSAQGYTYCNEINTPEELLKNVRVQLELLNDVRFSDQEWTRFVEEYLDKPNDNLVDKARKIHDNHIYDFVFDDGHIQNIYLLDKQNLNRNILQVINQITQTGDCENRYDATILVNGLPLVHIELKKRGIAIREAFNQIHRYSKESFNHQQSLFKYIQIFVISNGTDTRYFANTTNRDKNSFDFTMNWAKSDNTLIKDLKDFTATFFQRHSLLNLLCHYSVFNTDNILMLMRPYQIAATERVLWKIKSSFLAKNWSKSESGGFIWHTTGSGKTLTSFKTARLATNLPFIDKVLFVVDRKDLDYQTMKEYQKFSPDSVNGSNSTEGLKANLAKDDNRIVVTTIQKLNNLMKSENDLPIYQKQVVFIFDECHRSQFGEAQKNLKKKFKTFYQFGFTGTPILPDNAYGNETTPSVFGATGNYTRGALHAYLITDAIRDEKVLKFKVDYNDTRPNFSGLEKEQDEEKLSSAQMRQALLHPERIKQISQYILDNFAQKTHRTAFGAKGFNAMLAVSSVDAAKIYYETLQKLQENRKKPLTIATIFSFAANEEQDGIGSIAEESLDVSAMNSSAKEFLAAAINDYNETFKTNFRLDSQGFQNYYRDLAKRVKNQEVDLLIVVGMFLTGFDAPCLNTLFVDKNLRYHGLLQAYSRTNRIKDATKSFGNIVTFRDLEQATIDAIKLFSDKSDKNEKLEEVVLERKFSDYFEGYMGEDGKYHRGYVEIVNELQTRFPNPTAIETEEDKRDFAKLFGEYLRVDNILKNYDEFSEKKAELQADKIQESSATYGGAVNEILADRQVQDYLSVYQSIRDWRKREQENKQAEQSQLDWNDVVFEIELLKSQEINLDYILSFIPEQHKKAKDKSSIVQEIRQMLRASLTHRAKEQLVVNFVEQADLNEMPDQAAVIEAFFTFAQTEQQREAKQLIADEDLNEEAAKRYFQTALKRGYASENGTELVELLPKISRLSQAFREKKQKVLQKVSAFVEKFNGVGGKLD